MKILQVSTYDISGGAEKVAWNLFQAYRAQGYNSWLAVGRKRSDDPDVLPIPRADLHGAWSRVWRRVAEQTTTPDALTVKGWSVSRLARVLAEPEKSLDVYRGIEDFHFPGARRLLDLTPQPPDIIHCHNLHGHYFDLRALPWLSERLPVVLTLHDTWLLSGHCAYTLGCDRWRTGCGDCPDLTIYPAINQDATATNWRRKRDIYAASRLHVATPSRWLMRQVEQSMLAPAIVDARVIPNGVDLSVFHPGDQRAARAALDLPQTARIILFTANSIRANMFKDYRTLRAAVERLGEATSDQPTLCIALGEDAPAERVGQAEIQFAPFQIDPRVVALYYQAADVYAHAARADTFPNTILEALACGAPVVATAVDGIPEQIDDGVTGFLVPAGDAQSMAARLSQVLEQPALRQSMSEQAAQTARRHFDLERQVETYLAWYHDLHARRAGPNKEKPQCAAQL